MTTAVLLHGFGGSPESWRQVSSLLDRPSVAPALCGHAGAPAASSFMAEVDRLAEIVRESIGRPRFLAGYSLGGRLALGLLVRHADLFRGAALIGANPGLGDADARRQRRLGDERWARLIEQQGLAAFDREWSAQPLFRTQRRLRGRRQPRPDAAPDVDVLEEQRRIRLGHDPSALAGAMRALSLGAMPDFRAHLPSVDLPVALVVGGLDTKFADLAHGMAEALPRAHVRLIDGVGHNVPLEAPVRLADLLGSLAASAPCTA